MQTELAASQLEALGKSTRLEIYRALIRAGDSGLAVGALQDKLGIPSSTLSHHLKTLIVSGLISQERQATTLMCRANYKSMQDLIDYLVSECCADATTDNQQDCVTTICSKGC